MKLFTDNGRMPLGDEIVRFEQRWQHRHISFLERTWASTGGWNTSWLCNGLGCSGQQAGKRHNIDIAEQTRIAMKQRAFVWK